MQAEKEKNLKKVGFFQEKPFVFRENRSKLTPEYAIY